MMAGREGLEPPDPVKDLWFSKPVRSPTPPSSLKSPSLSLPGSVWQAGKDSDLRVTGSKPVVLTA